MVTRWLHTVLSLTHLHRGVVLSREHAMVTRGGYTVVTRWLHAVVTRWLHLHRGVVLSREHARVGVGE